MKERGKIETKVIEHGDYDRKWRLEKGAEMHQPVALY